MLRAAAIALGVCLVALAASGMRSGPIEAVPEAELGVDPAPEEEPPPRSESEIAPVAFALPERPTVEQPWLAPQISVHEEAASPRGAENLRDLFPHESDALPAGQPAPLQFPKREDWETFSRRLDFALAAGSIERLVELEPEARSILQALQAIPGHVEYADWLERRLEAIEVVRQSAQLEHAIATDGDAGVPYYRAWVEWMRHRDPPARAAQFVEQLKPFFIAAQVPPALVWLAETESGFNPSARNRVGASGLYQIMPVTARQLGLRLRPHDERLNPLLNAQSAARYLAWLHDLYQDWPLALAAYNAGPTRVSRLLKQHRASSFSEIVHALPTETQLYVPRVLATLTVREGVTPASLALTQAALAGP